MYIYIYIYSFVGIVRRPLFRGPPYYKVMYRYLATIICKLVMRGLLTGGPSKSL